MKATITKSDHTGKVSSNRKENNFHKQYSVLATDGREVVIARFYVTQSRHYCCVWINNPGGYYNSGGGYAGGYGYHRASAALENALNDAGVQLSESIHGRGDSAMCDALKAVMEACGEEYLCIIDAHA